MAGVVMQGTAKTLWFLLRQYKGATMALSQKLLAALDNLSRNLEQKVCIHPVSGAFVRIPGFKYDDFDRTGKLSLIKMDRVGQMIPLKLCADQKLLAFTVGRHWTFSSRLYQRATVNLPMLIHYGVSGIGNSSFDQQQQIFEDDDSDAGGRGSSISSGREPLASLVHRLVYVDPIEHRPQRLPDDVCRTLKSAVIAEGRRFPQELAVPPSSTTDCQKKFSTTIRVRHSDTDCFAHTNLGSYLLFAEECAVEAARSEFYSAIREDVAFRRAKTATSSYMRESHAGDELTVTTWEDASNNMLLHFIVSKDATPICYVRIEYFDDVVHAA